MLYVNDRTGGIDLVVNRRRPDMLYAATYEVQRYPGKLDEGGPGTGIYKTTDGGATWERLGGGLPKGPVGRIGLDIYQNNPDVLYAVLENLAKRFPTEDEARRDRERGLEPRERQVGGELYRTDDGGRTWQKMNGPRDDVSSKAGYSFNQVRVDQNNDQRVIINSEALLSSVDGLTMNFFDPAHYVNLARLYLAASMRKKAIETLEEGLRSFSDDKQLVALRSELGVRSMPVVPFLERSNPVNVTLGRTRHAQKAKPEPGKRNGSSQREP